jgi:hypothetical protein
MLNPQLPSKPPMPRWAASVLGILAVCAGLSLPWLLPAMSKPSATDADAEELPDPSAGLVRLYAATLGVLGAGVGGIFLYRRRLRALAKPGVAGEMEVMGAARIDLRSHVVLVRARGQKFLAGIDGSGLKLLVPVPLSAMEGTPTEHPLPDPQLPLPNPSQR